MPTFKDTLGTATEEQKRRLSEEMARLNLSSESIIPVSVQSDILGTALGKPPAFDQPLSVNDIKDSISLKIPDIGAPSDLLTANDNISNSAVAAMASATSMDEFLKTQQKMAEENQAKQKEVQETQQTLLDKLKGVVGGRQKAVEEQQAKFQIPETLQKIQTIIPEIQALNLKIADLDMREATEITGIEQNPNYSVQFAGREANRVAREYAIRKSSVSAEVVVKTATVQALQGNITTARGLISDVVNAMQADDATNLAVIEASLNINQDFISSLDKKEQDIITNVRDYWQTKIAQDRKDNSDKMNLIIEAAGNGINLGLSANNIKSMSMEEVVELYQEKLAAISKPTSELKEEIVGGFRVLRDETGKVITTREISAPTGIAPPGIPTEILAGAPIAGISLTPVEQKQTLQTLISSLPVGQQDMAFGAIASFKNAKQINSLLDQGVKTGPISGTKREGLKIFGIQITPGTKALGWVDEKTLQFDAATTAFTANYIKALSGVQVSDRGREFLMKALPD